MGQCCGKKDEREPLVPEVKSKDTTNTRIHAAPTQMPPMTQPHANTSGNFGSASTKKEYPADTKQPVDSTSQTTETFEQDEEKDFRTRCRALWDWNGDPTDPVQIAFKAGDLIALIDKEEGGWWYGECLRTKAVGFFPGNYVEVLQRAWKIDNNKINPKIAALQQNLTLGE